MDEPSRPRKRRAVDNRYREAIHLLNTRYHEQWERAELLERELAKARSGWLGAMFAWVRRIKRLVRPVRYTGRPGSRPGELRDVPCDFLDEHPGPVTGRVSIIIPFKDQVDMLRGCLRSIRRSTYRDVELILVNNGSEQRRTLRYLARARQHGRVVLDRPGPFNFSWLCNEGARAAEGRYLLFLNNDTEVLALDWLERLLRVTCLPAVGVVGATLLYPDRTLQHAGLFPRDSDRWVHAYRGLPADAAGDRGELARVRTVPAVTGACMLLPREVFDALGGFDEQLPVTYGDVDLCCRARQRGRLVVVTPHARLLHFEAITRGYTDDRPGNEHLLRLDRFPEQR